MWGYLGTFVLGFAACGWLIVLDELVAREVADAMRDMKQDG